MKPYPEVTFGAGAHRRQRARGSYDRYRQMLTSLPVPDGLGPAEIAFLRQRDSFYMASVGETGWPYVQHRGGPPGFIKVLDATTIAWAERSGNRQYISAGNVDADDRVALIAVDYPGRQRLKLAGRASYDAEADERAATAFAGDTAFEAIVTVTVEAFDWNCPKFITPRYSADEVREIVAPLTARIAELERAADRSAAPTRLPGHPA